MPEKRKLGNLTNGERLVISRRRAGYKLSTAAHSLAVTSKEYGQMERDEIKSKRVATGTTTKPERCFIHRRRAGMTQAQVAKQLGVSTRWFILMERGNQPCDSLLSYWEK